MTFIKVTKISANNNNNNTYKAYKVSSSAESKT